MNSFYIQCIITHYHIYPLSFIFNVLQSIVVRIISDPQTALDLASMNPFKSFPQSISHISHQSQIFLALLAHIFPYLLYAFLSQTGKRPFLQGALVLFNDNGIWYPRLEDQVCSLQLGCYFFEGFLVYQLKYIYIYMISLTMLSPIEIQNHRVLCYQELKKNNYIK